VPRPKNPELVLTNLRLLRADVATARRESERLGTPYQHIVRGWVADGAAAVRAKKKASKS
jgi:hypothetical protein